MERLRYLLIRPKGFRIYTDHRNLRFMYGAMSTAKLNVRARLDRWALKLQGYRFDIEHVAGELNLWADLLSRWGAQQIVPARTIAVQAVIKAMGKRKTKRQHARPNLTSMEKFEWPTTRQIQKAQDSIQVPTDHTYVKNGQGLWTYDKRIWIPDKHL